MTELAVALSTGSAVVALAVGLVSGVLCFGGLWWTVTRGMRSSNPALWLVLSSMGRLALVFGGFYLTARNSLINALMCALGLLIARGIVLHRLRAPG
jgi:F1F0 ATPase subunit 2